MSKTHLRIQSPAAISDVVNTSPPVAITPSILSIRFIVFLVAHVPLAILMTKFEPIATVHVWATGAVALFIALKTRRAEFLVYTCAYVAGSEVLWRMTDAQIFYEVSKYAIVAIAFIGLIRFHSSKGSYLPLLYFFLLLPSVMVSFWNLDLPSFKAAISFNLSGPLTFTFCALFLSRLWLTENDLKRVFLFVLTPIIGVCTLTLRSTLISSSIMFNTESNYVTSGGFGPNQVSAVLGLGALCCYLLFLVNQGAGFKRNWFLVSGWLLLTVESALTFSRGGLYLEMGAAGLASFYLFRQKGLRLNVLILLALLAIGVMIMLPLIDDFTGGKFSSRFSDLSTTGRNVLAIDDLKSWKENPTFGVGPGRSAYFRSLLPLSAHTEYTRLVAEHGLFGFVALLLLIFMMFQRWRHMEPSSKPLLAAALGWAALYMAINATRIAAPSLLVALPFVTVLDYDRS